MYIYIYINIYIYIYIHICIGVSALWSNLHQAFLHYDLGLAAGMNAYIHMDIFVNTHEYKYICVYIHMYTSSSSSYSL